ncbi:cell filamentation protein Fic [bacterium]|nr:cell filamentation protein Fic [bacterium]
MEKGEFLIYNDGNNSIKVEVFFQDENIWATQKQMANLFGVETNTINYHLKEIFKSNELEENSVIRKIRTTADDGKKYNTNFYNLDAIISVGYRVNSTKATQFRIWATKVLKEYVIKGFVMNDEKLKNPNKNFNKDYFQELLERVRSIRSSERRIYQKITDIFAECSIDYNKNSQITKDFYASVQNKFHYAITNKTAAEIIYDNANSKKDNMGLTTWKNSPNGRILKSDTIIAKNYLKEKEIKQLERTISSFFDYIERIIENHKLMKMEDLANSVDKFLSFNEFKILENKGKISQKEAEEKANLEYTTFNKTQKIESDFDKIIKEKKLK